MALQPSPQTQPPTPLRDKHVVFRLIGAVDDALYGVEKAVVSAALIVMSILVFLDVWFRFLTSQRGIWLRLQSDEAAWSEFWPLVAVLILFWLLLRSVYGSAPSLQQTRPLVPVFAGLTLAGLILLSLGMLVLPSSTIVAIVTAWGGALVVHGILASPTPLHEPTLPLRRKVALGVAALATLLGVQLALQVPPGYSWAQHIALFLMLWMAFIGASMATRDRRHLAIDAIRKAMPDRLLPWYNAIGNLVAAAFTLVLVWLAWNYLQLRMAQAAVPGEIPQWIKVLAIPLTLALVTARFVGQAIADVLTALLVPTPEDA